MGKYGGKVLYPYLLFRDSKDDVTDRLFRHEMEHVYQIRREGVLVFYLVYLWHAIRYGYNSIPYEVAAREASSLLLTVDERNLKEGST